MVPSLLSLFRLSITTGRVFTSWKTARFTPVYKKDDETDCCNYRPISLLSVPSKILESVVNDTIVRHVCKANNLVTDKQRAYRAGFSTELLLIQLTETWREAVDAGLVVAVAFIDFKKAFDSVSHAILETKLERDFGISGLLLDWLKSYLKGRQQYTAVNRSTSEMTPIDLFWNSSRVCLGADTFHSLHERSSVLSIFRIRLYVCRRHNGLLHK